MGTFAIISLILSIVSMGVSAAMQQQSNEENIANAQKLNESQQQFSRESAQTANEQTRQNYWQLYSPESKVKQYREAGLNPALMYSMGGVSGSGQAAAQAAQPSATMPTINPLLETNMQEMMSGLAQATQMDKTKTETKNLEKDTEKKDAEIKAIEAEIKNTEVSTLNTQLENKLLENELKLKDATLQEQIGIVKESYREIQNTADEAWERVRGMKIENDQKNELIKAEINKLKAEEKLLIQQKLLSIAQTLTEEAKNYLTQHQDDELQKRLNAIDRFGYMIVNGNGWEDRTVNGMFQAIDWVANKIKGKMKGGSGATFKTGMQGAGGNF